MNKYIYICTHIPTTVFFDFESHFASSNRGTRPKTTRLEADVIFEDKDIHFFICESIWKCWSLSQVGVAKRCRLLGDGNRIVRTAGEGSTQLSFLWYGSYGMIPSLWWNVISDLNRNQTRAKWWLKKHYPNEPSSKKGWQRLLNAARLTFIEISHIARNS